MITLITAVPGSGKSLLGVQMICDAVEAKRPVYSNIAGLQVEGCLPAPDDWRDTMEGSLVIYDEAQQQHLYPSTAHRGEVKDERLRAMEIHRHTGHDLVFISQSPSFLHHHIRKLAGQHIHLYRAFGMKTVTKYTWQHVVDSPNDRGEQSRSDSVPWMFPKHLFSKYKSATTHTHKFKIPKKLGFLVAFIVVVAIAVGANAYNSRNESYLFSSSGKQADPASASTPVEQSQQKASLVPGGAGAAATTGPKQAASTSIYDWADTEQATPVAGCISSSKQHGGAIDRCQCFSEQGKLLKMSFAACMSAVANPLPRSIIVGGGSSGSSSDDQPGSKLPSTGELFKQASK